MNQLRYTADTDGWEKFKESINCRDGASARVGEQCDIPKVN